MSQWQQVPLGEVALVNSGSGFPIACQGRSEGDYPFLKVSDMNLPGNEVSIVIFNHAITEEVRQSLKATAFVAGSIIFPKIGAAIATNKKRLLTRPSCADNNVMAVTARDDRIDPEFLFYVFQSKNLSDFASDSNPPSIRKTVVEAWKIPLPPIGEQRHIVDILKRADGIRRLRKQAIQTARELIPALFVDMFGDPATNPKGWNIVPVSSFVSGFEGGKNIKAAGDAEVAGTYRVLKVSAVTYGEYRPSECKPLPAGYVPPNEHFVRAGDLLFSRANTEDLVGATTYVFETPPNLLLPDKLWRFVWPKERSAEPLFIWSLFQNRAIRAQMSKLASGTSGSMKNISQKKLFSMPVPLPALELQTRFVEQFMGLLSITQQQQSADLGSANLFASLLHRAFRGEL